MPRSDIARRQHSHTIRRNIQWVHKHNVLDSTRCIVRYLGNTRKLCARAFTICHRLEQMFELTAHYCTSVNYHNDRLACHRNVIIFWSADQSSATTADNDQRLNSNNNHFQFKSLICECEWQRFFFFVVSIFHFSTYVRWHFFSPQFHMKCVQWQNRKIKTKRESSEKKASRFLFILLFSSSFFFAHQWKQNECALSNYES